MPEITLQYVYEQLLSLQEKLKYDIDDLDSRLSSVEKTLDGFEPSERVKIGIEQCFEAISGLRSRITDLE